MLLATLFLIPVIGFAALLLGSPEILAQKYTIPLLFDYEYVGTLLQILTIAFVAYVVLMYIYYTAKLASAHSRNEHLEQETIELKAELYNGQKDIIDTIAKNFDDKIHDLELTSNAKLERIAKFNEYTLEKVLKETQGNFETYKKEAREFLLDADIKDEGLFKKLKIWK